MLPSQSGSRVEADGVFHAVDRLIGLGLCVLGAFGLLFIGLSACFAMRPPPRDARTDPAMSGDGTRVATLLRNPRLPPRLPSETQGLGTRLAGSTVTAAGDNLPALVDGQTDPSAPVWRSASGQLPIDLQFAAGETARGRPVPALAGRILFAHSTAAAPETWAKDVEVWVSLTPEQDDPQLLGRWTLDQRTGPQVFAFPRQPMWALWLRILSNYGSAEFTSLAEFGLLPAQM